MTLKKRSARQLTLMAEIASIAGDLGMELWLRGGWAADFVLGQVMRSHEDIDFFIWSRDAEQWAKELRQHGYAPRGDRPPDQQLDCEKDGEELSFALLGMDAGGRPVVAGGPSAGAAWPLGMLEGPVCRLEGVVHRVISVESQIEIKEMMPIWVPRRPRRAKDRDDIERLRAASSNP